MLTEKNFVDALKLMNFTANGNHYEKIFAEGVVMRVDLSEKKLYYPAQLKGCDRNDFFDESHKENLVVFECVNRLLDKGYKPEDIELERRWQLGHSPKGGRADICVSSNGSTLFIVECKTSGTEFNQEIKNMLADGGQLFSYWQQEQSCQWLMLYASDFDDELKFEAKSIKCDKNLYREAHTVEDKFKIWDEHCDKKFFGDVIFHDETVAYQIGAKPLRKRDLEDFIEIKSIVNKFEEILRHNQVSNKANAFDVLIALFICKLVDETLSDDDTEVSFQFKEMSDTPYTFQDRLQKLYRDGMEKFMKEPITYVPLSRVDELLKQIGQVNRQELSAAFRDDYRKLKFFNNNAFAFIDVHNEKLFKLNSKVLVEVVDMLQNYFIIGSKDLHTLGILFEQLLNKGFKQDEGQFFTPIPIAHFIWDSLPLDEIISIGPPKIIDYACGAGHFLTEGFQAVNDCFARKNLPTPILWERDRLFGVEKDDRLARVSKISLFMHGANEGKIKFGDGLENYPDENISPATFDILVANPPYSVKGFKSHLKLANKLEVLKSISNDGSEIETLFVERINQLVKPRGVAAVILPSSILNKDGKSFVAARESLLKNFYIRAIVQLGSKTFGATGTNTVILFLQKIFDPPERAQLLKDSAEIILQDAIQIGDEEETIFADYLKKIKISVGDYRKSISNAPKKTLDTEREKIICFGLTYRQTTLIISAPNTNDEQEKFLGYGWSNAKGREGMIEKKIGGMLFDNDNRAADNTLAAVIRAAYHGEQIQLPALQKYFYYSTLSDLLDFDADNFTKKITLSEVSNDTLITSRNFSTIKLGNIVGINAKTFDPSKTPEKIFHYVDIGSVDSATNKIDFSTTVTGATAPSRARRLADNGDVLISTVRPYLKSFARIKDAPSDTLYSTGFAVLSTKNPAVITNEFIYCLFMDDPLLMAQMKAKMSKGSYPSINQGDLQNFYLILPPLDVQRQIVAEFRAIDDEIAAQSDTIENLDANIQKKFTALFEGLKDNVSLENIFQSIETGSRPKGGVSEFTEGILSLGGEHIDNTTGYLNLENKKFVPKDFFEAATSGKIRKNDILICKDGALSGKVALVRDELKDVDALANEHVFVLRNSSEALQLYLFHYLFFKDGQQQLKSKITGMAQGGINRTNLSRITIPLPPLELQEEFATYVANCEAMKKSARTRREELIRERGELVTKYFK